MANFEKTVKDVMVTSPMTVQPWQLMLMHSFSFLPVRIGKSWWLVSAIGLAKFLGVNGDTKKARLAQTVQEAQVGGMELVKLRDVDLDPLPGPGPALRPGPTR